MVSQFSLAADPSAALLGSHLVIASEKGRRIDIYKFDTNARRATISITSGFASVHLDDENLVVAHSEGMVYVVDIQALSVVDKIELDTPVAQSVLAGRDLFLLHPEGFDQISLDEAPEQAPQQEQSPTQKEQQRSPHLREDTPAAMHEVPSDIFLNSERLDEDVAQLQIEATEIEGSAAAVASHSVPPGIATSDLLHQMQSLFLQQATLFENMLVTQQKAEKLRYDQMLQYISDTWVPSTSSRNYWLMNAVASRITHAR